MEEGECWGLELPAFPPIQLPSVEVYSSCKMYIPILSLQWVLTSDYNYQRMKKVNVRLSMQSVLWLPFTIFKWYGSAVPRSRTIFFIDCLLGSGTVRKFYNSRKIPIACQTTSGFRRFLDPRMQR